MASCVNFQAVAMIQPLLSSSSSSSSSSFASPSASSSIRCFNLRSSQSPLPSKSNNAFTNLGRRVSKSSFAISPAFKVVASVKAEPLKIMISGAPASGKGTQCELIVQQYGLVHIAAGDLLRAEIASGSENGKRAKEFMERGQLVPNEIVVLMIKDRLSEPDSQKNGWLLDGYPRSSSQATALKEYGFQPDLFILLEVPEEILVERVVGRRLDPVTEKIYHLKYSPPETEEIAARLTQRFDDTKEKVKLRLRTHNQNVEAVVSMYKDVIVKIKGDVSKEEVFAQIDTVLTKLLEKSKTASGSVGN